MSDKAPSLDLPRAEEVAELFEPVKDRAELQRRLGVQPEVVRARLLSEFERLDPSQVTVTRGSHGPHLAYLRPSPWLSARLGRPVFQLRHLLGARVEERVTCLRQALEALHTRAPGALVIARVPSASVELNQRLPALGLRWVGLELTGVISLEQEPEPLPTTFSGLPLRFAPLSASCLTQAQEIARSAHSHNHFEYDPLLERALARALFQEQVARHLQSERAQPFGAHLQRSGQGEELCGFIVANRVDGFVPYGGPRLANLDFICVNPTRQLKGLGHALNLTALSWLYQQGVRRVTVRTMVNNFAAQSILKRVDWRATLAESVYHLHL